MVLEDIQLPRCSALPFPPDNAFTAISEWFAMSMTPITEEVLRSSRSQPPDTQDYRMYKLCKKQLNDPKGTEIKARQKKVSETHDKVKKDVLEAVRNFRYMFLYYNKMIADNTKNFKRYRVGSIEKIHKVNELVTLHRKFVKSSHTMLYLKDALEEAVATYEDAEVFMKKVGRESFYWETPERIQQRYSALMEIRRKIEQESKEETDKCEKLLNEMLAMEEEAYSKVTLLLLKARHLDRVIQDVDDRILREEAFLTDVQAAGEKAWRDYSLINMSVFDLSRGFVEMNDYNPSLLKGSLWDRLEFIRREHMYNKEILRRWGLKETPYSRLEEQALGESHRKKLAKKRKLEEQKRVKKLKSLCRKYARRGVPKKVNNFLRLVHVRKKGFPRAEDTFDYMCSVVGEGKYKQNNK